MPRLVEKAKIIEEKVARKEVKGHTSLNNSSDKEVSEEEDKKK